MMAQLKQAAQVILLLIFWTSSFKVSAAKKGRKRCRNCGKWQSRKYLLSFYFWAKLTSVRGSSSPLRTQASITGFMPENFFAFYMLVRAPTILFTRQSSITGFVLEIFHFHFLNFYFSSQWAATFPFLIFDFNILQQDNQCLFHELQRMHAKISAKFLKFLEVSSRFKFLGQLDYQVPLDAILYQQSWVTKQTSMFIVGGFFVRVYILFVFCKNIYFVRVYQN